ncbi:glutathione S-transferase family protein [uncultured Tateyamaria sp.]|uniref:glutathione S-transferase family protein n=1 Tax=uncultured Tateyamaria sp. TaxID=455651 RepID=UPI00261618C0|nr:glutathione S-transferase family protein [uncultured Tateyamaria sp.]
MLTYYYSRGSSSLAAHILLIEVGARFDAVEVPISDGAHRAPDYLRINPKGRIPALQTPDGLITENAAILEYIAATHADAATVPSDAFTQAQARAFCAYLGTTVHVAYAHARRGDRWANLDASLADMKARAPQNLLSCADFLEKHFVSGPWALGGKFSFCDPYLFLLDHWLTRVGASLDGFPKLSAHKAAMMARPATRQALAIYAE